MRKPNNIQDIKLNDVKNSDCGCVNCLYNSIECKNYERFKPFWSEVFKQPGCEGYVYYD